MAPFKFDEGQHQGAIESSWLFSLGVYEAFQRHINGWQNMAEE